MVLVGQGDAAVRDSDDYLHIMSRTDDILNVAGHRLSTGAIEAAIATHPAVAEVAVFGPHDELKGQVPVALVVVKDGVAISEEEVRRCPRASEPQLLATCL